MLPTLAHAGGALFAEDAMAFENACGAGDGCWTNYLRMTDLDGDDDLDVVAVNYAGFFELGSPEPLVVYTNDGGVFTNTSAMSVEGFEGRIRQVAIGDVDGDGDPDMYVPDANGGGDVLFVNDGGVFSRSDTGVSSNAGAARFGDFDDDGDYDLFLADGYNAADDVHGHIYLNDGSGAFEELDGAIPAAPQGSDPDDVDLLDADGDYDLDILLNNHSGTNELWLNDGAGMFSDASAGLPGFPNGFHYGPAVCDVDGDGDLDVWVDNMATGYDEMLMINDGSGSFTDETAQRVSGNDDGSDDNGLVCLDVDYDGDMDAVVISLFTAERYLQNDGAGNFTEVDGVFMGAGSSELWGELGDVDGDGRLDLATGAGESATPERLFLGTSAQMVDTTGPGFRAVQMNVESQADTEVIVHFAVTDNAVTDEGPRLHSAFVRVTVDGSTEDVPAWFMGGDLFRAVLPGHPDGTVVEVQPCATDREDNEGCAEPFTYEVGVVSETDSGDSTGPGDTDGSGSDTDDPSTSGPTSGSASASATTTATTATSDGETDTEGGSGQSEGGDGGGCGCTQSGGAAPFALLLLAVPLRRRRR